ncbi:MAG TPA: hypothetical protein VKR31_03935 [Rhizomicrobium sp.]|nr:hypothetical protein [Rhizomicrobium sp.]
MESVANLDHPQHGIEYRTVHGIDLFRCEPYKVSLSRAACAQRYLEAETATKRAAEKLLHCRGCAIGAFHAGVDQTHFNRFYDTPLCPRCHKTWLRLIGSRVCVSCYNREREFERGINAKGKRPAGVRPIYLMSINALADGKLITLTDKAHNRTELVLRVMRTTPGRIIPFANYPLDHVKQGRLL